MNLKLIQGPGAKKKLRGVQFSAGPEEVAKSFWKKIKHPTIFP